LAITWILVISSLFLYNPIYANVWSCTNSFESQCSNEECDVKTGEDFTPIGVSFDDSGAYQICAYSGCWEGEGEVNKNGHFLVIFGKNAKWSSPTSAQSTSVLIGLNTKSNFASVQAGDFVQPIVCKSDNLHKKP
jgi:site-specific DNA-adenine methylase